MMDLDFDRILAAKMLLFFMSGLFAMIFAYYRKWSESNIKAQLADYMLGDGHAIGRALTTLVVMLAGASGMDFLDALTFKQIALAGIGIGLIVPDTVEKNKGVKNVNPNADNKTIAN